MASVRVEVSGDRAMFAAMRSIQGNEKRAARTVSRALGKHLEGQAKRQSSGPARVRGKIRRNRKGLAVSWRSGGPGVVSGHHRRSIGTLREGRGDSPYSWFTDIAPGTVYSRRLELGFRGPDRLGRVYNQPAYRYMRPARADTVRKAGVIAAREFGKALRP